MTDYHDFEADASAVSEHLYNQDLAPIQRKGRTWNAYNIFTLWANDVHSLGNYTFAIGLFALGLGAWQILLVFLFGSIFLFILLSLSGLMGEKTGVPFPVISRISFGIHGAKIAAAIRGGVAILWFGVQTYLASIVLRVLVIALFPTLQTLDTNSLLGLSTLGWLSFLGLWVVQLVIVSFGMEMIRRYEAFAGPVILVTMLSLAIWMFFKAGGTIAPATNDHLTGAAMWREIFVGSSLWVVIYGTFVLNFCDFTRSAVSKAAIIRGNFFGIPLNMLFFAVIVVVLAGTQYKIDGRIIESPSDIIQTIPNTFFLVLACLALVILTIAVNLMANFVAPIYMLTNFFPKHLDFRRASLVSAVIGFTILPWNLYNTPVIIVYFLGGIGALLGPVFGIIMMDYWWIRKARINIPCLYTESSHGDYYYNRGFNMRAILAFIPAAIIAVVLALVPMFSIVAGFSWFFGAGLAALFYFFLMDREITIRELNGEVIAVPCK